MSKFLKSMIVLLAIVAMATPVMAEDMLSLGGQMRVRASTWDDGGDNTESWVDQRMRIGGKLSIADGVSITFRFDATEKAWGQGGNTYGAGRLPQDGMQWDRAHIDLAFNSFSLRAGQQYIEVGALGGTFNAQDAGIKITTKGAVPVTAFIMIADANNVGETDAGYAINQSTGVIEAVAAADAADNSDGFYYGANVAFGADAFKGNVFGASQKKVLNAGEEVYLIGANTTFNMDAFKILAELDFFTGDASATADAFGTQLFVDASMAASETMTFGGQIYYAMGDDEDTQYAYLGNDFNGWDPLFDVGSGLDNGPFGATRPQEFFGDSAGVIAGRIYGNAKVTGDLNIGASISYLEPEEDTITVADSALVGALGMKYAVMSNTSLGALVEYIDVDAPNTDSEFGASVGLFVNF